MCRISARGFTLLELLFCLLIIGALLGAGFGMFQPVESSVRKVAQGFADCCSRARVDAILTRKKVGLKMNGRELYDSRSGDGRPAFLFPADMELSLDNKNILSTKGIDIIFSPLGHTLERLLHLRKDDEFYTVYLPAIGAPGIYPGLRSLDDIREIRQ